MNCRHHNPEHLNYRRKCTEANRRVGGGPHIQNLCSTVNRREVLWNYRLYSKMVQVRLQVLEPALLGPQADGDQCVSCSAVGEAGVLVRGKVHMLAEDRKLCAASQNTS